MNSFLENPFRTICLILLAAIEVPIAIQALGGFGGGAPTVLAPCPMSLALPFLYGLPTGVVSLFPALLFLVLSYKQFFGVSAPPLYVLIAFATSSQASIIFYAAGYHLGLDYEGAFYTNTLMLITITFLAAISYLYLSALRRPSLAKVVAANWLLSAWVFSYGYPWLGEGL